MNDILIGSFIPMTAPNFLVNSIHLVLQLKENCFMIFTGAPQSFKRTDISLLKTNEFKAIAKETSFNLDHVIIHMPYIINPATNEQTKSQFAVDFIGTEITRVHTIGAKFAVLHPGSATNGISVDEAIINCANVINQVNKHNVDTIICLETMSGKGNEIGKTFQELAKIVALVEKKELIGVCMDTCHMHDSGYNIGDTNQLLTEFDKIVGIDYLKVVHVNDSENEMGSHKDRHANIGYGKIGFENIINFCYHKNIVHLPKILETPDDGTLNCFAAEIQTIRNKKFQD
jgi:deoxyribonuclease-4